MSFGLSMKYPLVDFEEVSPLDLILIGGGCGDGGGGSTHVTTNTNIAVSTPGASIGGTVSWGVSTSEGAYIHGTAKYNAQTGQYSVTVNQETHTASTSSSSSSSSSDGGFWSGVMNFFRGWFGSN